MDLTRIIYHLRSLAAELEKLQPARAVHHRIAKIEGREAV